MGYRRYSERRELELRDESDLLKLVISIADRRGDRDQPVVSVEIENFDPDDDCIEGDFFLDLTPTQAHVLANFLSEAADKVEQEQEEEDDSEY